MIVVDSSVVLAFMLAEPGGEVLADDAEAFCMSSVNLAEVLAKVDDRGLSIDDAEQVLRSLGIVAVDHDGEDAVRSARLRAATRHAGLSPGDRACLALAKRLGAPVLTADRVWATLSLDIDIRLIR